MPDQAKEQVAPFMTSGLGIAHLAVGFLVMALVTSLGGTVNKSKIIVEITVKAVKGFFCVDCIAVSFL